MDPTVYSMPQSRFSASCHEQDQEDLTRHAINDSTPPYSTIRYRYDHNMYTSDSSGIRSISNYNFSRAAGNTITYLC
jgi:hypothetical protein